MQYRSATLSIFIALATIVFVGFAFFALVALAQSNPPDCGCGDDGTGDTGSPAPGGIEYYQQASNTPFTKDFYKDLIELESGDLLYDIFDISGGNKLMHKSLGTAPISMPTLEAGIYKITLVSFDGSSRRSSSQSNQWNERWMMVLFSGGEPIVATDPTTDLRDDFNYVGIIEATNLSTCIPLETDAFEAVHRSYNDAGTPKHSVFPVATIFRRIGPADCDPTPQCANPPCILCQSSPPNACGMVNFGILENDGTCTAVSPPDSLCPPPDVTLKAEPKFVQGGETSFLTWTSQNATECELTGPGVSYTGVSGTDQPTPPISETTEFTLTCRNEDSGEESNISVRVLLRPEFQEF